MTASAQKRCPDCGAVFECGMGTDAPCWCSSQFAPVMPVPVAGSDCYCESCLKRHVERVAHEKPAPG
ncbi:MAG: cysteine-rich CWC family protein [Betaproteobacteria bacterium]